MLYEHSILYISGFHGQATTGHLSSAQQFKQIYADDGMETWEVMVEGTTLLQSSIQVRKETRKLHVSYNHMETREGWSMI